MALSVLCRFVLLLLKPSCADSQHALLPSSANPQLRSLDSAAGKPPFAATAYFCLLRNVTQPGAPSQPSPAPATSCQSSQEQLLQAPVSPAKCHLLLLAFSPARVSFFFFLLSIFQDYPVSPPPPPPSCCRHSSPPPHHSQGSHAKTWVTTLNRHCKVLLLIFTINFVFCSRIIDF